MTFSLYHFQSCPFCQKVRNFIEENSLQSQIEYRDIKLQPEYKEELISIGGKKQVPCLVIDGKALYESDDIIRFIQTNFVD